MVRNGPSNDGGVRAVMVVVKVVGEVDVDGTIEVGKLSCSCYN